MLNGFTKYVHTAGVHTPKDSFLSRQNIVEATSFNSVATLVSNNKPTSSVIGDFVDTRDHKMMNDLFRDIYLHDPIAGSAVDLMSVLPYSTFSLIGLNDKSILETYLSVVEGMNLRTLFPSSTIDNKVFGKFLGAFHHAPSEKTIKGIIPFNIDNCELFPTPMSGHDPIIDVKFPKEWIKFLDNKDPRFLEIGKSLPPWMQEGIRKGKVLLDNLTSLYIPRRSFASMDSGVSVFERIVPIYLLEKSLLRGTIVSAGRRQRPIGHLLCGDEEWEPTDDELKRITDLFQNADSDPIGAFVATRNGVQYQDIRSGQDLWRYEESYDFASSLKMKALGINESLLSGDANYSTIETALSVFIEQILADRDMMTHEIFYDKMFPIIAHLNGFKKQDRYEVTASDYSFNTNQQSYVKEINSKNNKSYEAICSMTGTSSSTRVLNPNDYQIPKVQWHKQLKPRGDRDYLEILNSLTQMQIPVPIRMYATASGISLDEILNSLPEDVQIKEKIASYNAEVAKFQGGGEGGGGDYHEQWSLNSPNSPIGNSVKSVGILNRSKNADPDSVRLYKTLGSKKVPMTKYEATKYNDKFNKTIAKAAHRVHSYRNKKENEKYKEQASTKHYHK